MASKARAILRARSRYAFGDKAALFRRALGAARRTGETLAGAAAAFAPSTRGAERPHGRGRLIANAMVGLGPEIVFAMSMNHADVFTRPPPAANTAVAAIAAGVAGLELDAV